jgi:RNA polymerase sigma-70 factor (ECF subfamily)
MGGMSPEKVFEILVRENADMLWAFLMSVVRDRAVAEDLFQETYLTAWKNLERYDSTLPFGPWLRGIAGKLVLAHRRKSARSAVSYCDEEALTLLEAHFRRLSGTRADTWDDKLEALRKCMARLAEPQRQVIELYYRDGLDCAAIADRLGQGLESIKKRLQRARAQLTECIMDRLSALAESAP